MENGTLPPLRDLLLNDNEISSSRDRLRPHRTRPFHLRHQTDRLFRYRDASAVGRRRLPVDPGHFFDPVTVAQSRLVALYESRRAQGRVLGVVARAIGG